MSGAVSGTGSDIIANHGILEFQSSVSAGQTVTYQDATGTLALSDPGDFSGHIAGLAIGDTIDLTGIAPSHIASANIIDGQLVVDETSGGPLTFNIAGNPAGAAFVVESDGHGGTDLVLSSNPLSLSGLDSNGNALVDHPVSATLNVANASGVTYTWTVGGQVVANDTDNTFTPTDSEEGKAVQVTANFTVSGAAEQTSASAGNVGEAPLLEGDGLAGVIINPFSYPHSSVSDANGNHAERQLYRYRR